MSAAAKVLNTTELLESVLLQLRYKDILLLQRVCKAWKTAINRSPTIQKALCFKPTQVPGSGALFDFEILRVGLVPYLTKSLEVNKIAIAFSAQKLGDHFFAKQQMIFNPVFLKLYPLKKDSGLMIDFYRRPKGVSAHTPPSWKNMYLTQPPVVEVLVESMIMG